MPDDVAVLEGVLLVGTAGLAAQRGVSRERVRQAAQRARARLLIAVIAESCNQTATAALRLEMSNQCDWFDPSISS
jgi:hypothetical protein